MPRDLLRRAVARRARTRNGCDRERVRRRAADRAAARSQRASGGALEDRAHLNDLAEHQPARPATEHQRHGRNDEIRRGRAGDAGAAVADRQQHQGFYRCDRFAARSGREADDRSDRRPLAAAVSGLEERDDSPAAKYDERHSGLRQRARDAGGLREESDARP